MYGKIFEMIYEGSLYGQWEAIVTFQQMIVLADDEGFVDLTPHALAARTSIPLDIIQKGIEVLEKDDPYSRTEGENGKRILRICTDRPWGWKIVNYLKYRNMASNEDRKRYMREYMKDRRKQKKLTRKHCVNTRKQTVADVTHTNTDTNTDKLLLCPQEKLVDLYHTKLPELARVKVWSEERQVVLRARWNQAIPNNNGLCSNSLEWWEGFFDYIRKSDFLMGRIELRKGEKPFRTNFEWIIKKRNFINILEGKYHR